LIISDRSIRICPGGPENTPFHFLPWPISRFPSARPVGQVLSPLTQPEVVPSVGQLAAASSRRIISGGDESPLPPNPPRPSSLFRPEGGHPCPQEEPRGILPAANPPGDQLPRPARPRLPASLGRQQKKTFSRAWSRIIPRGGPPREKSPVHLYREPRNFSRAGGNRHPRGERPRGKFLEGVGVTPPPREWAPCPTRIFRGRLGGLRPTRRRGPGGCRSRPPGVRGRLGSYEPAPSLPPQPRYLERAP